MCNPNPFVTIVGWVAKIQAFITTSRSKGVDGFLVVLKNKVKARGVFGTRLCTLTYPVCGVVQPPATLYRAP